MWSLVVINDHKIAMVIKISVVNTINDHIIFPVVNFSMTEQHVVVESRFVTTTFLITTTTFFIVDIFTPFIMRHCNDHALVITTTCFVISTILDHIYIDSFFHIGYLFITPTTAWHHIQWHIFHYGENTINKLATANNYYLSNLSIHKDVPL